MENLTNDVITILQYLLPGFVSAWVFYSLTSYPKPSQFERVVQALIFTIFIQAIVVVVDFSVRWLCATYEITGVPDKFGLVGSVVTAILLGVSFAGFANNDLLHKCLRRCLITRETSYPSEWFGAFLQDVTFVVLHLNDERRLYGWPIEWPSEPHKGHFVIADPSWLNDDGTEAEITGVSKLVISASEVKWVEFLEKNWE